MLEKIKKIIKTIESYLEELIRLILEVLLYD